jgi:hypothetical protein
VIEARTYCGSVRESRPDSVPFAFPRGAEDFGPRSSDEVGNPVNELPPVLRDPVTRFESFLTSHGLLEPGELPAMANRIDRLVETDLENAEAGSFPDSGDLLDGVFANPKDVER